MLIEKNASFIDDFIKNFNNFKTFNIVLYGIGVKTKSIVENVNFNFIGLMDKDPENIGKKYFGLKILNHDEVIQNADLIIIVAGDVYFTTILSRIKFLKQEHNIPIYFCDGQEAHIHQNDENIIKNPYWTKKLTTLKSEIDKHEVISFDIFDTLITRTLTEPINLFEIIGKNINDTQFTQKRIKAELDLGNSATINKIYDNLPPQYKKCLEIEKDMEIKYCIPRLDIVEAFNYAIQKGKEVYLISDIYHNKEFIIKLLKKMGIYGYKNILISCELNKRKSDKSLWLHYYPIIKDRKALHIGDDLKSDVENIKEFNINSFHILSPYNMLKSSTWKNIVPKICTLQDSLIMGLIISKIFNSPFALSKTKGQPLFNQLEDIGYVYFSPVLLTYLLWILRENIKNKTEKILFVARDGYFLEKLYNLIVEKKGIKNAPKAEYLMISRSLITILNIQNEENIEKTLKIKFNGKASDYFQLRFGIDIKDGGHIDTNLDMDKIKLIVNQNKSRILKNAAKQRNYYMKYIKSIIQNQNITIVDPSFNGTNQFFLSKLLNKKLKGYYCNANLSNENPYYSNNNMLALFQDKDDYQAKNSNIRKYTQFLEAGIFVAPTGTCLKINNDLSFEFSPLGKTQKTFFNKEKIYNGVAEFINDFILHYDENTKISPQFIDFIVGEIYNENTKIITEIKNTFFVDTMYETVYDTKMFE